MSGNANVVEINADNWKTEVLDSSLPVLVDFWAEWCGPCKAIAPFLHELAEELKDKMKLAKVNVDENESLSVEFAIRSIPSLILFKEGKQVMQSVGGMSKAAIKQKIMPYLG